jgi:glycosyltransferase involved in cell wall biosynthesis
VPCEDEIVPYRLAIVASHVIQYQDPFFRLLAADPEVELTVIYCARHGADVYRDEDMKTSLAWDIDLLSGYRHIFLRNLVHDLNRGYTRLTNPGIVPALARGSYDAVIFMTGWGSLTALAGIATCRFFRIPSFLYGDSSLPPPEDSPRASLRAGFLRAIFGAVTGFMVSGVRNADYYAHYGGRRESFFLLPWAIDNDRFAAAGRLSGSERRELRARYAIPPEAMAILYSAKLVLRKDPFTLLRAFARMQRRADSALVFMGDGELRPALEAFALEHRLGNVHFLGFVNQRDIPRHYAMCDVFVLPSTYEPRGAVINEAMACGLPVVVTDRCGSIGDIVMAGDNAFVFEPGDDAQLATDLDALAGDAGMRARMGERSRRIISQWNYQRGVQGVKEMLRWVTTR